MRETIAGAARTQPTRRPVAEKAFETPSTKTAAKLVKDLGWEGSVAVVIPSEHEGVWKSFRNLPRVNIIRASDLNTYHVLWHRTVLLMDDAWDVLIARLEHRTRRAPKAVEAAETKGSEA